MVLESSLPNFLGLPFLIATEPFLLSSLNLHYQPWTMSTLFINSSTSTTNMTATNPPSNGLSS